MAYLLPELAGNKLTVELALKQPTRITARIATLADQFILIGRFFHPLGRQLTGGAMVYDILQSSDLYTTDVHQRGPGDEYEIVGAPAPVSKIATVEDWGGKFPVSDEQVRRNDIDYFQQQTTRLANTITAKLDARAMAVINAAITGENTVPGHNWLNLVTVGPETSLTPSASLPTADFSASQLAADLQQLGMRYDLLIVHPQEAHSLRVAYGERLDAMLSSAGLRMYSNIQITPGTAWLVQAGQVGIVGFEEPLTTETWREPKNRTTWVQSYAVPALGVNQPMAMKKLTGLAG